MPIRDIEEDYEAKLLPVGRTPFFKKPAGKVERERFSSGEEEFEAKFRNLALPDGSEVDVLLGGEVVGTATLSGGRGKLLLNNAQGHTVPPVHAGQIVEIRHRGDVLLRGSFKAD